MPPRESGPHPKGAWFTVPELPAHPPVGSVAPLHPQPPALPVCKFWLMPELGSAPCVPLPWSLRGPAHSTRNGAGLSYSSQESSFRAPGTSPNVHRLCGLLCCTTHTHSPANSTPGGRALHPRNALAHGAAPPPPALAPAGGVWPVGRQPRGEHLGWEAATWPPGPRAPINKHLGGEPLAHGLLLGQCSHRSSGPLPGDPTGVRPLRDLRFILSALCLQVAMWEPQGDWVGREPLPQPLVATGATGHGRGVLAMWTVALTCRAASHAPWTACPQPSPADLSGLEHVPSPEPQFAGQ